MTSPTPITAWVPFKPSLDRPWSAKLAAHLFRRAGFAANTMELDRAVKEGLDATLDRLFSPAKQAEATTEGDRDFAADPAQFESQMSTLGDTMMATGNPQSLSSYWLFRMLFTPDQLLEKTTLFWHGHFATSAAKVDNARLMLRHGDLLRTHALGRFEPFVQAVSRDPAMLLWLDAATNRKVRPNENYARELMELFCLGVGRYTEDDIREVARAFTGSEVVRDGFRFNQHQHDEGVKSFLGKSGNHNGDDAVRIILAQPAASRFIAGKLVRYFVAEEPSLSAEMIEPIAAQLRDNSFDIGPVIRRLLSSDLFFSDRAIGRMIKSPVSLAIGLLRALEGRTNMNQVAQALERLGQAVFYPPNVKGWEGGRTWINSSTLLGRANLVRSIIDTKESTFGGGRLDGLAARRGKTSPQAIVDWLLALLVAVDPPREVRERLIKVAETGGDHHIAIGNTLHAISALPEFQLG